MLELFISLLIYLILLIPTGLYLFKVLTEKHTFLDPVFNKIDAIFYYFNGKYSQQEMNWKQYTIALLTTNFIMMSLGYLVLRLQNYLFFNPNSIEAMASDLSFNTIISFMTNTNLQHYSGESGLSYLSQMLVITFMMFSSAATGYAACAAFIRGITGFKKSSVGNFYRDLIRITTRVLLPFSVIGGLLLVWQGVPQNLNSNILVNTLEGTKQIIATGPVAALEIIKHLGTNGGGYIGANSSTPIENPTVLTNLIEMYSMMLLPGACVIAFGKMANESRKKRLNTNEKEGFIAKHFGSEGFSIFLSMSILFILGLMLCCWSESQGNPLLSSINLNQDLGNMEGKEMRFGVILSSLFTTVTTSFTTGTVNNMHDSLTPLGGLVPMLHMMLNVVFGGKGVGLMNMIIYVLLTVFICGLTIGRTPEYLGKKIEGREMKLTALCIIIHPLLILAFSAIAISTAAGQSGITNAGFHGLSQVLYEYASSAANNGSGFEGLSDNTLFWNVSTGLAMFFGRYLSIILQLAIIGSLMQKNYVSESAGTLKTDTFGFSMILVFIVYIFAALTFFPALSLGPIAEHLTL